MNVPPHLTRNIMTLNYALPQESYLPLYFSWGTFEYQKLSMRLCNGLDICQEKFEHIVQWSRICIDELLIISNKSVEDYVNKLDKVLQ